MKRRARIITVFGSSRPREVELGHPSCWGERDGQLVRVAASPSDAATFLAGSFVAR